MESATGRQDQEQRKQAEIRRQIALLQAQLKDSHGELDQLTLPPSPPKRKQPEATLLAPATPSPKKKRKLDPNPTNAKRHTSGSTSHPQVSITLDSRKLNPPSLSVSIPETHITKPAPSNVLSHLANLSNRPRDTLPSDCLRSSGFSEKPLPRPPASRAKDVERGPKIEGDENAPKRDDRLALIEDLEVGPIDHKPPFDDPHFEYLEPNSGIRLSSRIISYLDIQEYLTGRFYLSPSSLYSSVRLLPSKQGYDVPVAGDWVTIAVVAERGPVKYSRAPVGIGKDDGNGMPDDDQVPGNSNPGKRKERGRGNEDKPIGKRYVNIKLVDFGARSRSSSSATGGKAVIRGDALLTLLLFESDGFDIVREDGGKPKKVYKGGSRGAFETMSKVKEGDVVALLNSRILKPFQRSSDTPHPTNNILALTPESASSIAVIGRARDLGMCGVLKRDGKPCGSWCDKRVSDVCEYHVQNAVERRRAGRAEFSVGTSGMSTTAGPKRKPAYDPARQWGLKPAGPNEEKSETYVISGHVVNSSVADSRSVFITENMGREGQAKARRKMAGKDADKELKALLERDKEGMRAVVKAREVGLKMDMGKEVRKTRKGKGKKGSEKLKSSSLATEEKSLVNVQTSTSSYSASVIRSLGFDPSAKPGQQRADDSTVQRKLEKLAALQSSRKQIELGPRPGQRVRSGVVAPPSHTAKGTSGSGPEGSDPEMEQTTSSNVALAQMVDLDASSDAE